MRSRRTARTNRFALTIIGVFLLAGGIFALGQTQSLWFSGSSRQPLLTRGETTWVHANDWVWLAAAAGATILALVCLRWLLVQARTATVGTLDLEADPITGYTRVDGATVARAIEDELNTYPEVRRAHAQLTGHASTELRLSVATDDAANLVVLRHRIETELVPHARQALETEQLAVDLNLVVP